MSLAWSAGHFLPDIVIIIIIGFFIISFINLIATRPIPAQTLHQPAVMAEETITCTSSLLPPQSQSRAGVEELRGNLAETLCVVRGLAAVIKDLSEEAIVGESCQDRARRNEFVDRTLFAYGLCENLLKRVRGVEDEDEEEDEDEGGDEDEEGHGRHVDGPTGPTKALRRRR